MNSLYFMSYKQLLLIIFIKLLSVSCSNIPPVLKTAERLMDSHPDSALVILNNLTHNHYKDEESRALYGLLLFRALNEKNLELPHDSVIDFSVAYYLKHNDKRRLPQSLYFKARILKKKQYFENAVELYIQLLDMLKDSNDYNLLGDIYIDLGEILSIQGEYNKSREKFESALDTYKKAENNFKSNYALLSIGRTYRLLKDFSTAKEYTRRATVQSDDSIIHGIAYLELGIIFNKEKEIDSAKVYLQKSLKQPGWGTNYCIRCVTYADLMFDLDEIDSASHYALKSLDYRGTFYNRRDCYRIMANCEYSRKNLVETGKYMGLYQDYTDSVRKIETQTKGTVLENLHTKTLEAKSANSNTVLISLLMALTTALSAWGLYALYGRNRHKRLQLENVRRQLHSRQELVSQGAVERIERARQLQSPRRRGATPAERERLDRELYHQTLHLSEWGVFCCEMNHTFNHVVDKLQGRLPAITRKEITWCCLELLGVPPAERALLLETTPQGLYKLKQRLAQRLGLDSTRELDAFLRELVAKASE